MKIITTILAAILVDNVALSAFAGSDILPLSMKKAINVKTLGIATAIVVAVSGIINAVIESVLPTSLGYLQTLIDVVVVLAVAYAVENYTNYKLGKFAVLVILNGAALTVALTNATNAVTLADSVFTAIGAGIGFAVVLQIFKSIRKRISDKYIPEAFRGLPTDLLVIAIMAMAVTCFK